MAGWRTVSIATALLLGGCLNQADSAKMDAAETQFFAQAKAKQYEAIYDAAAPEFKAATTADTFVGMMQRIDRKLGDCQSPVKQLNWRANATTEGYFMTQGYASTCANGKLDQTLSLVMRNGVVQVEGYDAKSPLLLTD
jgi:outer membrane murein-binding lipoprotein Lpp